MRAICAHFYPGNATLGRQVLRIPSLPWKTFAIGRSFTSSSSCRENESSGRAKAAPWSQHTLKPSPSSPTVGGVVSDLISKVKAPKPLKRAYIALGSNLGDRVGWIEKACNEMEARGIKIKRTSCLWETEPMYVLEQEPFINGACEVETHLEPLALLDELQSIENDLGRHKVIDKGPRNIDLDVLLYGDEVVDHPRLKIPHALMHEREFVLRPLADLIPGGPIHPSKPWKVTQDYLNALPPSSTPLTTITPLRSGMEPLRALNPFRPTQLMEILNMTPDSFSDGGLHDPQSPALTEPTPNSQHVSIFDIGGQSSAPGAEDISSTTEIERVRPLIEAMRTGPHRDFYEHRAISVDTYRADVAEAAINAGADIINDISAGQLDQEMLATAARLGKTICLMHMRGTPSTMSSPSHTVYPSGVIPGVARELLSRLSEAEEAGIRRWRIILDPGIGFAKTTEQNLELLRGLGELRNWPGLQGLPWLVGTSRKSFIGNVTGVQTPKERTWGTAVTVAAAVSGGADVIRVHDIKEMEVVVSMADAIWRGWEGKLGEKNRLRAL